MIIGIIIAIVYTMGSVVDLAFDTIWKPKPGEPAWDEWTKIFDIDWLDWKLFVVLPMWLIVILISIIAIWIGYSMLTTPAPVPLEELEEELAAEEEAEESEES
ncbi:MAG: hypothetical protein ACFFHD_03590 [Promethearchaeota archaeon]